MYIYIYMYICRYVYHQYWYWKVMGGARLVGLWAITVLGGEGGGSRSHYCDPY